MQTTKAWYKEGLQLSEKLLYDVGNLRVPNVKPIHPYMHTHTHTHTHTNTDT